MNKIAEQVAQKHLYHKWRADGFCIYGCRTHRTDFGQQSPLCYVRCRAAELDEAKQNKSVVKI